MALNLKAAGIYAAHRARPVYDGLLHTVSRTLLVPSGTLITDNSVLRFMRVQANKIVPTRVIVDINGNLDGHATPGSRTLVGTLGYLKSSDRNGTNLSTNAAGSTATEDDDFLLLATSAPVTDPGTVDEFGTAGDGAILSSGGVHVYNALNPAAMDSRGYDANVMDVAVSITEPSSTATTADILFTVTLEFAAVPSAITAVAPEFLYKYRYNSSGVSS